MKLCIIDSLYRYMMLFTEVPPCVVVQRQINVNARKQYRHESPDSKVHGANMGPIWGRQDPGGPHVGPMNFAIWEIALNTLKCHGIRWSFV